MWQCTPTSSTDVDRRARSTARSASPLPRLKPNFESSWPGGDELVGVGVHARRDPQQDLRGAARRRRRERVEPVELVERVDDDVADAGLDRHPQLGDRLVVAVQHARRRRHTGSERDVQLAARGDVEQQPLVVRELGHRLAQERLGRVDHALVAERGDRLAAAVAQVRLVVDEQRRAELGRQLGDRAPADVSEPSAPTAAVSDSSRRGIALIARSHLFRGVDAEQAEAVLEHAGGQVGERQPARPQRLVGLQDRAVLVERGEVRSPGRTRRCTACAGCTSRASCRSPSDRRAAAARAPAPAGRRA